MEERGRDGRGGGGEGKGSTPPIVKSWVRHCTLRYVDINRNMKYMAILWLCQITAENRQLLAVRNVLRA